MDSLTLASVSFTSTDDKSRNLEEAEKWIRLAHQQGAQWILLPEIFPFNGSYRS